MSYILDALKKMEQEKNMKAAPKERINLSGALLKDDLRPPGKARTGKVVGLILTAVIAVSGVTWYFLNTKTSHIISSPAPQGVGKNLPAAQPEHIQAMPAPAPQPVPTQGVANTPVAAPAVPPAQPVVTPSPAPSAPESPMPKKAALPAKRSVAPAPDATEDGEEAARPVRKPRGSRAQAQAAPTTTSAASVAPTVAAPANIKISGIAWQEERSARRAVVNDLLMKEGNLVSGAKITDILRDRVRFSLSGGTFEVPLLSSATPDAGK